MKSKAVRQNDDSYRFVFYPKNNEEHEICVRFQNAARIAENPNRCRACIGSGLSTRGTSCIPCRGTGLLDMHGKPPLREDGGPNLPEGSGTTPKTRKKTEKKAPIASNPPKTGSGGFKKRR